MRFYLSLATASFLSLSAIAQTVETSETVEEPDYSHLCEGDGCDAYLPTIFHEESYVDPYKKNRLNSALGGLAGGIIGEDVAGLPGAIAFGALGAVTGWHEANSKRWEEKARDYDAAWKRGDDTYYDPSHPIPLKAHWMYAGPILARGQK